MDKSILLATLLLIFGFAALTFLREMALRRRRSLKDKAEVQHGRDWAIRVIESYGGVSEQALDSLRDGMDRRRWVSRKSLDGASEVYVRASCDLAAARARDREVNHQPITPGLRAQEIAERLLQASRAVREERGYASGGIVSLRLTPPPHQSALSWTNSEIIWSRDRKPQSEDKPEPEPPSSKRRLRIRRD